MLKLPFKTSPKAFELVTVGNPEIGELELPKYGDLSPNERLYIKSAGLADIRTSAVKLAKAIATSSNMKLIAVYNALVGGDSEFLGDYLEEFVGFQDLLDENSRQRSLVLATAMLRRIVPEWELSNTQDATQIHPSLVSEVADFARNEEAGWVEVTEVTEVTEEDLGNSETPQNQIGEKSTGESEDTGLKSNGSRKKALATSQPG